MDGTIVETTGQCKQGMDISYKGIWGYHPLVLTLAETGEVLRMVNRSGNRPSQEGAAGEADHAIDLCRRAGFRKIALRGDTAFTQTIHLDRWNQAGVKFLFGMKAYGGLVDIAENVATQAGNTCRDLPNTIPALLIELVRRTSKNRLSQHAATRINASPRNGSPKFRTVQPIAKRPTGS